MLRLRTSNDPGVLHPCPTSGPGFQRSVSEPYRHPSEERPHAEGPSSGLVAEMESAEEKLAGAGAGGVTLERRLAGIEERQKRIEEMLMQLTSRL